MMFGVYLRIFKKSDFFGLGLCTFLLMWKGGSYCHITTLLVTSEKVERECSYLSPLAFI